MPTPVLPTHSLLPDESLPARSGNAMKDLGKRSITAVFWGAGGSVFKIILQFVTQVALARILGPSQYGIFAIGAMVVSFSNFFADIGIAYGLIQKKEVHERDIRFVFTWQILIGSAVSVLLAALAPYIAGFFGKPESEAIVRALAIICLINALAAPSLNLLKRNLNFRNIQLAQISGFIGGYILTGLPLALAGWEVWALVIAWLVQSTLTLILLYASQRHSLLPLLWYENASTQLGYGSNVLATNLTNWLINNIDRVFVGRLFPGREIGLYTTPYNLLYNPTSTLMSVIQPVFFSASSRVTDDRQRVTSTYCALTGAIALLLLPVFCGIATVADTFVLALYGATWQESATVLQPLALAMPLFLVWGLTTPLLWTGGHTSREFLLQIPVACVWVIASWFAAQISITLVAWSVLGLFVVRAGLMIAAAAQLVRLDLRSLWLAIRGGIPVSLICAACLMLVDHVARLVSGNPVIWLSADILTGAVVLPVTLRYVPGLISPAVAALIQRVATPLPASVRAWLHTLPVAGSSHVSH